jgi:hypothetical protein
MKAGIQKVKNKDFTWLIILILIAVPIIIEYSVGEDLYNDSHDSILDAQEFMVDHFDLKMFEYVDIPIMPIPLPTKSTPTPLPISNSFLYSFLDEAENDTDNFTIIQDINIGKNVFASEFIHLINSNGFYFFLSGLLYNFMNIYKIFILFMTVFSSNYISASLSYIFQSPKPYMAFFKIKPATIFNEWGCPNAQIVTLVSYGFSLYKVLVNNKSMEKKLWAKIVLIIFLIGYAFIDIFLLFAAGNCTYNQLIMSLFLSIVIFLVFFYLFKIDLNNSKQFFGFIKFNLLYYLIINAVLFTFQILLSIFITDERDTNYYKYNAKIQISIMPWNDFVQKYCKYRKLFFLNTGSLCNVFYFLMNIVAFIAIKADLHYTYKGNYNSWCERNFEKINIELVGNNPERSSIVEYSHLEHSQWNHTGFCLGTIRFIALFLMISIIYGLFILISSWSDKEAYCMIFLIIFPSIIHVSGVFYFYKVLLTLLKLTRPPKKQIKNLVY